MKFVIDMTASMQPQLDAVRRAMRQLTALLGADEARARLRYGLVGYTDVADQCAGCPFELARDFFPDGAVGPDRLRATLADDPAARAGGGGDWPEAALEGVAKAIEGAWGENTLRFVVLIGDASANALGDGKGGRLSPESVRRQADAANVRIVALHAEQALGAAPTALQDAPAQNAPPQDAPAQDAPPSAAAAAEASLPPREDAAIARRQFSALALNPGQRSSSYLSIKVDPEQPAQVRQQYYDAVYGLAEQLSLALNAVRAGRVRLGGGQADRQADRDDRADAVPRARAAADAAFDAALISYLGAPAARPRDITFWALDVDPKDMVTPTLEVRVLLEKRELENLIRTLEAILEAFLRAKSIDGPTFFSQLQAAATSAALDSQLDYGTARSIAETGLLPRWLATLPYRSQIMSLTPERFSEMSADARDRLEQSILRKLFAYRDLYASDDWIALWPGADDFDQVYPVLLSDLP
ncbi:MAG: vWA domain-containing protein, partial [Pseudomonadota bacterium]